jgi:hypothetical protein
MDLDRYVTDLRLQLVAAAERGGDETRALVEWLGVALESATRLVLIEALSDAAAEVTASLAPAAVEVRMRGRDPELVVLPALSRSVDEPSATPTVPDPEPRDESPSISADDAATSRTTLRLPDSLKERAEQAAQEEGVSLNAWLVRAIACALEPKQRRTTERQSRGSSGSAYSGWVR